FYLALFAAFVLVPGIGGSLSLLELQEQGDSLGMHDPDIWMRLNQARQWISGETSFFDHRVLRTNAPFGGIETPWTRPLDALIYLSYVAVPSLWPETTRLLLAAVWLPILIGFGAMVLLCEAALLRLRHVYVLFSFFMLILVTSFFKDDFKPLQVDHHGLL